MGGLKNQAGNAKSERVLCHIQCEGRESAVAEPFLKSEFSQVLKTGQALVRRAILGTPTRQKER